MEKPPQWHRFKQCTLLFLRCLNPSLRTGTMCWRWTTPELLRLYNKKITCRARWVILFKFNRNTKSSYRSAATNICSCQDHFTVNTLKSCKYDGCLRVCNSMRTLTCCLAGEEGRRAERPDESGPHSPLPPQAAPHAPHWGNAVTSALCCYYNRVNPASTILPSPFTYIHTYTHINTYIYTHTYIHTYRVRFVKKTEVGIILRNILFRKITKQQCENMKTVDSCVGKPYI